MSTALYRRYRPETFAEVIGQEHVTEPLMTALQNNRVNHAYLFSGPRGCGKTTSARILARCLNCAQGPTPTPCGTCDSCQELARDGSGSLDVIEMDAASHGGVDHARDLRERATFAPVRDRFKIFIIDEAHMVTREGFNALLKIVEEPPEHIKFIFATTEPNKVLGTIRSRTHHYPFRLVPPEILHDYLAQLCEEEGVTVEDGVLQLVVRAGGGSVRDSLSTLDQLMAGSDEKGITYDLAVALLGFTHAELLDEVVISFATGKAADVFTAVDRVIQTGQDPRRFVEDLLERFRDLIIVQAVPEAAESILHGMSADQIGRLRSQAAAFGSAELSRAADVTNAGLNEMSGATSPQLHLELLCARILLPASDKTIGGVGARLDRLERRVARGDIPAPAQPQSSRQDLTPEQGGRPVNASDSRQVNPPAAATAPLANLRKNSVPGPAQKQGIAPQQQAPHPSSQHPQSPVLAAQNSWQEIVGHVQSPQARQGFAQCEPSKFENGALYIRGDIATLRQVKDYISQLKTALREVIQLDADVHAEVLKPTPGSGNPQSAQAKQGHPPLQPKRQERPAETARAEENSAGNQSAAPSSTQRHPEIAEGPRGGEEAWKTHGRPLSTDSPRWSTEDWNNPVTNWDVAPIPSGDTTEDSSTTGMNTQNSSPESTDHNPAPETGPQLRVIDGEANENTDRSRVNHPSSGVWQRPDISAAPSPDEAEPIEDKAAEDKTTDPVTAGEEVAEKSAEESPVAASPEVTDAEDLARYSDKPDTRPANTGIADGTAEAAPADKSMIPEPDQPEDGQDSPKVTASSQPHRPVAEEYGDYEGSHFDDAPAEEPEYVAGMGYVNQSNPSGLLPPLAQPSGAPPLAGEALSPRNPASDARSRAQPQRGEKTDTSSVSAPQKSPTQKPGGFRERFAAQLEAGHRASEEAGAPTPTPGVQEPEDFSISEEDEALETSVLIGQRAIEKVLGGVVIEETPHGQ